MTPEQTAQMFYATAVKVNASLSPDMVMLTLLFKLVSNWHFLVMRLPATTPEFFLQHLASKKPLFHLNKEHNL